MGVYKNFLVALDESDSSHTAFKEIVKLILQDTETESINLTAMTVAPAYTGEYGVMEMDKVWDSVCQPCKAALAYAEQEALSLGLKLKKVCVEGEAFQRIADYANENDCDLIVLGRRGISRLARALMGSITFRVIGYSTRDVLVVPRDSSIGFKNIVLAMDGSKCSNAAAIKAIDVARSYGGKITAVSVVEPSSQKNEETATKAAEGFLAGVLEMAKSAGVPAKSDILKGPVYSAVTDFAALQQADVIIIGSHGRTGLMRLIMGNTAEKIIGHAHCPTLVVR
ncbi:MAG: universal stress protein [Nitrospinae bacterium]|nr:universal stress protein [Nitrospinota bacterium]